MRFIGNKEKLLENIHHSIPTVFRYGGSFCDFFSGTSNVGRFFKEKGFRIISSDLLYFSYILQKAYIENNTAPEFRSLLPMIESNTEHEESNPFERVRSHLNSLKGKKGFIYSNYTEDGTKGKEFVRKYFTSENGMKIDAIRVKINEWRSRGLINESEYCILIATLIESVPFYANISGVYAAFLKAYDPRALKKFSLKPIRLYLGNQKHSVYNVNSMDLVDQLDVDVLYLDPPYNNRQYAPNYHLLETIALYDNPKIRGVTGMRDYSLKKSEFCNQDTALAALDKIAGNAKYKCLVLSYNSEGIMPEKRIISTLKKYGTVKLININYLRFKSNSNGDSSRKKLIQEQLYVLKV